MNKIFEILRKTDLIENISKWEFDINTEYMFLPFSADDEEQIFAIIRSGIVSKNHFKLELKDDRILITFLIVKKVFT